MRERVCTFACDHQNETFPHILIWSTTNLDLDESPWSASRFVLSSPDFPRLASPEMNFQETAEYVSIVYWNMQNNEWQKYICLIFMTIAEHCNWMLIAPKLTRGPSLALLHPTQRSPKSVRASSLPIFPRHQLPWTRGQLLIFSVLLLSAPRSCTPLQTWKLVPPFFGEKAATPNEGWHSSSSSCSSYSYSSSSCSCLRPTAASGQEFSSAPKLNNQAIFFSEHFPRQWQTFVHSVSLVQVAGWP